MRTPSPFQVQRLFAHSVAPSVVKPVPQPPAKAVSPVDQRTELSNAIAALEKKLQKLDSHIRQRESEGKPDHPRIEAKKERAAKENTRPQSIIGKAGVKSGSAAKSTDKQPSIDELKSLATRVRGQIAVAKQKLAAL